MHFGSLDFIVTMEGELEQVCTSVSPLRAIDLDSIIEALEELKLPAPKACA
jgi:hypothetical protein